MFKFIKDLFIKKNKEASVDVEKLIVKDISEPVFSLCACIEKFPKKFKLKKVDSMMKVYDYKFDTYQNVTLIDKIVNISYSWHWSKSYNSPNWNLKSSLFTKDEIYEIYSSIDKARNIRIEAIKEWKKDKQVKKRERLTEIYKKALETN